MDDIFKTGGDGPAEPGLAKKKLGEGGSSKDQLDQYFAKIEEKVENADTRKPNKEAFDT